MGDDAYVKVNLKDIYEDQIQLRQDLRDTQEGLRHTNDEMKRLRLDLKRYNELREAIATIEQRCAEQMAKREQKNTTFDKVTRAWPIVISSAMLLLSIYLAFR
jgi:lipid II:glycine glycyltransferase (peptidoglycan interpeptide bridge formation enzyme)